MLRRAHLIHLSVWLLAIALAMPARAQLILDPSFHLSPAAATGGGTISIGGSRLADGHYEVRLNAGRDVFTLLDIPAGTGEFQRYVRLPALPVGIYTVELRVNGTLRESRSYKILSPLAITPSTASPRAGSTLRFTVSGLAKGSLTLLYAGKVAFGPVNVDGGSYSGRFVVPTDRPANLPASVPLVARNAVGRTVPRVGSTTLSVQPPDRNPLVRIGDSTLSSGSITPRQRLSASGTIATNELPASEASTQYWWRGPDGRVVPMGSQRSIVAADGRFTADMRSPQLGTLSAQQAIGAGAVFAVGQGRDRYGTLQQRPQASQQGLTVGIDTDAAIDLNLTLKGSDGLDVKDARVILASAQLDALYPPNDNTAPVSVAGGMHPGRMASQFDALAVRDEALGCPDDLERQTSDASGKVEFEFALNVPQGGYNVDGSGPAPTMTIQPTEDCIEIPTNPTGGNTSASQCRLVDPAGIHATVTVIASHTGYGWLRDVEGNGLPIELPLKIDLRIDRYTGQITTRTCPPDTNPNDAVTPPCDERNFQTSANLTVTLPKLASSGLLLSDVSWTQGANATWPIVTGREGLIVNYAPMPDLSAFKDTARFVPASPTARTVQIGYVRGAGNPLEYARLHLPGRAPIELSRSTGNDSCDVSATEVWQASSGTKPDLASFLEALRFPGHHFGAGTSRVIGYVVAKEQGTNRIGVRPFRFRFSATPSDIAALANLPCPAGQPFPCVAIDALNPHQAKVTPPPGEPTGQVSTGNGNLDGCDGPDCDDYSELKSKRNSATAHLDQQFCLPTNANQCGAYSAVDSSHQQHSRAPDTPPPGFSAIGAGGGANEAAGWTVLFEKTIPLFRWYWGVPEIFSAEVFADLGLRAEYLFNYVLKPLQPMSSYVETGGRMHIPITIGVDVDVLFGILVDAGAAITGTLSGEVVARARASAPSAPCVNHRLSFGMDFSYWVEIGCPFPNPFDPTCYIPDIEGSHPIFAVNDSDGGSCLTGQHRVASPWQMLESSLAAGADRTRTPALQRSAVPPAQRRAMNRHPAIAIDGAGNRLTLYINSTGALVADDLPVDGTRSTATLSTAYGLRDVAVMHYATDRAVAVWAQSDLTSPPRDPVAVDLASRQHLRYAVFDGDSWSAPRNLTSPGFGEGGVRLARCKPRTLFYRSDCQSNKVGVVFQRNTARRIGGESHIYLSQFDGTLWTLPRRVDTSGTHNITPAITYLNAQPLVAWVRYQPDADGRSDHDQLSDVGRRNLAMRLMDGGSPEEVHTRITRVAQPDLAITSSGRVALAYTRAAGTDAFVGTRQALHIGERTCASGSCTTSSFAVRDAHGRMIFGERPRLVPNGADGVNVLFRGLAFGAMPGAASPESNVMPGDPIGMRTTHGELLNVVSTLAVGQTHVLALSNDAGGHFQPSAAFDPVTQEIVSLSARMPAQAMALPADAADSVRLLARTEALDDGLQLSALPNLPDLAIETLHSPATRLTPGANLAVSIGLINGGAAWQPDANRSATLRLYWDTPATRETLHGQIVIPALAAGARHLVDMQVPVPATFGNDERQTLVAELLVEDEDGELDGANNAAQLTIGGMPVPAGLHALSVPGSRIVNLAWDAPADPRVAGYRIWIDDDQGVPVPLGSSFNPGFADLSALFGFERRYRVSTYSARGIESELSAPVLAGPAKAIPLDGQTGETVFSDSFE